MAINFHLNVFVFIGNIAAIYFRVLQQLISYELAYKKGGQKLFNRILFMIISSTCNLIAEVNFVSVFKTSMLY